MSFPFFPTLTPPIASSLWFDVVSQDDETEINQIETDHQNFLNLIQNIASDLHPIGKLPENIADQESDDEANDESEDDSASHDNSDEDVSNDDNQ